MIYERMCSEARRKKGLWSRLTQVEEIRHRARSSRKDLILPLPVHHMRYRTRIEVVRRRAERRRAGRGWGEAGGAAV